MNLFATILTYTAPSANYRGESAENRSIIQKVTKGRFEYAIVSPEAMRNALRDSLQQFGLPCNRERLGDEEQLAVRFKNYPDRDKYADDFFMGWLIATKDRDGEKEKLILDSSDDRGLLTRQNLIDLKTKIKNASSDATAKKELMRQKDALLSKFTMLFKHDSVLRMNMAVALEPYRHDAVFTQSPLTVGSLWKNSDKSALLHRETAYTSFQYPLALNLEDCRAKPAWTRTLLQAIGELNGVAGNHARSYFEMAPASLVVRLTRQLVAGYDTYGFRADEGKHRLPEVVDGILKNDYPGNEFFLGGQLVKDMDEKTVQALTEKGAILDRNPQLLLMAAADCAGFPPSAE